MAESENQETLKEEMYSNGQSSQKNCHLKESDDNDELSHSERDNGIDPEKRKRRSSILKQKLGNQSDYLVESISCKASRRVSFASSNFVKPFAADPEKNTIWDNTYEEEVNHTDSTKSSEGTHASGRMNMTSFQIWESNSVQYAIPESIDQSEKENTVPIARVTRSNETNLNITEMELTGTYGMSLVQYVKSQQVASSSHDVSLLDMSFTCGFPKEIPQVNKTICVLDDMDISEVNNEDVEMELTTIGNTGVMVNSHKATDITNFRPNMNETQLQPIDMEFTSDLTSIVNNQNTFLINRDVENSPVDMEFTTLQAVVENCSENMDITCHQNEVVENIEKVEKELKSTEKIGICIDEQKPNIGNDLKVSVDSNKENFANLESDQALGSIPKITITYEENFPPESITQTPVDTNAVLSENNILQKLGTDEASKMHCNISIGETYTEVPIQDMNQTGKTRNILYSQPIRSISSDISCNVVTPTMSFMMSLSNLSPCAETTQQLIQATFSKPESINILLKGKNVAKQISGDSVAHKSDSDEILAEPFIVHEDSNRIAKPIIVYEDANEIAKPVIVYEDPIPGSSAQLEIGGWDMIQHSKSICDITPMIDDEEISLVDNEVPGKSLPVENIRSDSSAASTNYKKLESPENICSDSCAKYSDKEKSPKSTRRRAMIAKLKAPSKITYDHTEAEIICDMLCKEHEELNKDLKEIIENIRFPIFEVVDVEALRDASEESSTSLLSEGALNDSECQKRLSIPDIVMPMSLLERVREAAERCEKYWQYDKSNESYYVFYGCFRAVPFKVHVQPESGKVLGLETFNNLLDESSALTHYEAEVFKMKLKQEHLSAHLGSNFDLLTLLDYVCICTDEIEKFHLEFHELIAKYGFSHKLKMHRDNRASFEILHVKYIICWKISVTFSTTNLGHVESVCATHELQEKVDEDEIKRIAENCVMGLKFLRCFIEKVDEYVEKMGGES